MSSHAPNPYKEQEYQRHREDVLDIIPKSSFLAAVKNTAGTIFGALMMTAVAAIVGHVSIPIWTTLVGAAMVSAGVSAYAGYLDEKMSKKVSVGFGEARQIADARVNARETATALTETLGSELRDIKEESCRTQTAVAHLQKQMLGWRERAEQGQGISNVQQK